MGASVRVEFDYYDVRAGREVGLICEELVSDFGNTSVTFASFRTPVDTGRLRAGNEFEVEPPELFYCAGRVFNATEYAEFVHNGTPYMPPRPFLAEGAAAAAAELNFIFTD